MALKTDIVQTPTAITPVAAKGEPESAQTRTISAGSGTGGDGAMLADGVTGSGSKEGSGNHPVMETAIGEPNAPAFIYRKMPVYPKFAERSGWEGNVILKLFIDEQGQLRHVQVVESTWQGFTEAALDAVRKSSFSPGRRNGSTVRSEALLAVRFSMK
jgi:protein TonB